MKPVMIALLLTMAAQLSYSQPSVYPGARQESHLPPRSPNRPILIKPGDPNSFRREGAPERKVRLRENSRLIVRLQEPISSMTKKADLLYATGYVAYPVHDYRGNVLIPAYTPILIHYATVPGKRFYLGRGEVDVAIEPIVITQIEGGFSDCSDCADLHPGNWDIVLPHGLESTTFTSGKTYITRGEGRVRASRLPSSSLGSVDTGLTGQGAYAVSAALPGGGLIHGIALAGAGLFRFAFGKSDIVIPENSTLRFGLGPYALVRNLSGESIAQDRSGQSNRTASDAASVQPAHYGRGDQATYVSGTREPAGGRVRAARATTTALTTVNSLKRVTVITGMDVTVDGRTLHPLLPGTQADLWIRPAKAKQFVPVASSISDANGSFAFENAPCGCAFKVLVRRLDVPGAQPGILPLVNRPPGFESKERPLPCQNIVELGRYSLRLAPRLETFAPPLQR